MHERSPYVPVDGRPLRMSLGLRTLDLEGWLEVDGDRDGDLAAKQRLLADRHDDVVAHLPTGQDAAQEVLDLVVEWLESHHPRLARSPDPALHPVDAAGRLVQEDLCVLTPHDATWRLTAASVCSPSRWRLADKMGASVGTIHDPVPDYHRRIGSLVDTTLDRLEPRRPLWRLNWTILDDPAAFQPSVASQRGRRVADLAELTFRVERQTLRRLPRTRAVLFTIRTYRTPLSDVVASPARAHDLAATLRTCSPALAEYKGWTSFLAPLIDTLEAVPVPDDEPG